MSEATHLAQSLGQTGIMMLYIPSTLLPNKCFVPLPGLYGEDSQETGWGFLSDICGGTLLAQLSVMSTR